MVVVVLSGLSYSSLPAIASRIIAEGREGETSRVS